MTSELSVRRVVVLGVARAGTAAIEALEQRDVDVVQVDRKLGNDEDLALLDGVDVVVKSPGISGRHPLVVAAVARGIPVWAEVELGYRLNPDLPLIGVTGTSGKTSTVQLLVEMFRAAGADVVVAGNHGPGLSSVEHADWVICELSGYQLEDVDRFTCRIAVLLNIAPHHHERFENFDRYREVKLRVLRGAQTAVVPGDLDIGDAARGSVVVEFSAADPLPAEPPADSWLHRTNAAAAVAVARAAGLPEEAIASALGSFEGVPNRIELVGERGGVRFVNDSRATGPHATRAALAAHPQPVHLIVGGDRWIADSYPSFDELAADVAARGDVRPVLVGGAAETLAGAFAAAGVPVDRADGLEAAFGIAAGRARVGEVVLLSPGCWPLAEIGSSEAVGEEFRRLVRGLGS